MQGSMQNCGGLCTLTSGRVVLFGGLGHNSAASVGLADRLVRASVGPEHVQGLAVAEQRRGNVGATSFGEYWSW